MGEMSGGTTPGTDASDAVRHVQDGEFDTGVDGVKSSGQKNGLHVFDVGREDFYNNLKASRQRTRFKSDTAASAFLRGSKYASSFYVRYKDDNGEAYIRKVK